MLPDQIMQEIISHTRSMDARFGAALVKDGEILALAHNQVTELWDPTAHAEIQVIRTLCNVKKVWDLEGVELYTTCEPCPMCLSACVWAGVQKIIFGADLVDATEAGHSQIVKTMEPIREALPQYLVLEGGIEKQGCRELLFS